METTRRPRTIVPLFFAATLIAGACSSDGPPAQGPAAPPLDRLGEPLTRVLAASDRALEAESMHMTFEISVEGSGEEVRGSGEADVSLGDEMRQHATFHYGSLPGLPGGFDMEMIMDGSMMYMRMPQMQGPGGPPTEWISIDMSEAVPGYEELIELSAGRNDPTNAFGYLQGAERAEEVGTETVNGIETTHYRGTMNLAHAITELPADLQRDMRLVMRQFREQFGTLTMPFEIWIDADGLLRRMVYVMEGEAAAAAEFSMEMSMDVTEYGNDFELDIPPADDVTDISELVGTEGA